MLLNPILKLSELCITYKETSLSDRNAVREQELQFILIKLPVINFTCNINKKQKCYLMLCYSCTPSPLKTYDVQYHFPNSVKHGSETRYCLVKMVQYMYM